MKKKTFHSLQLLFIKNKNSQVKLCSVSGDTKSSSASTRSSRAMVLLQLLWSFEGGGGVGRGREEVSFFFRIVKHRQIVRRLVFPPPFRPLPRISPPPFPN